MTAVLRDAIPGTRRRRTRVDTHPGSAGNGYGRGGPSQSP